MKSKEQRRRRRRRRWAAAGGWRQQQQKQKRRPAAAAGAAPTPAPVAAGCGWEGNVGCGTGRGALVGHGGRAAHDTGLLADRARQAERVVPQAAAVQAACIRSAAVRGRRDGHAAAHAAAILLRALPRPAGPLPSSGEGGRADARPDEVRRDVPDLDGDPLPVHRAEQRRHERQHEAAGAEEPAGPSPGPATVTLVCLPRPRLREPQRVCVASGAADRPTNEAFSATSRQGQK